MNINIKAFEKQFQDEYNIKELKEYCGGSLHRQRNGYAGINGNIEYVAEKC